MRYTPAERRVLNWLYLNHFKVETTRHKCPYDVLCDGQRVEIKVSALNLRTGQKTPQWVFNIQRHGILSENFVDFYVLRLEGLPKQFFSRTAIHLVLKAPLQKKRVSISPRSLLTTWGQHFNRIDLIKQAASVFTAQAVFPASDKDARGLRLAAMTSFDKELQPMTISKAKTAQ